MSVDSDIIVKVSLEQGECRFEYFNLVPINSGTWKLEYVKKNEKTRVAGINVNFSDCSTQSELMYEKCVLLVRLPTSDTSYDWRFAFDGIEYVENNSSDGFQDIRTEMTADGKTLSIVVQDMNRKDTKDTKDRSAKSTVDLRFIASRRDLKTNQITLFSSDDPTISIGRGEG